MSSKDAMDDMRDVAAALRNEQAAEAKPEDDTMKNPADLLEVCLELIKYIDNGDPAKDVIEKTPYSETELIYELAIDYVRSRETVTRS